MPIVYSAVKRFDPACGAPWQKFIEWSHLTQLREVVSLDLILCPTVFQELNAEDWQNNVQEDFKTSLFLDLDYVVRKVAGDDRVSVLALMQNPTEDEFRSFGDRRFAFRGFDLVELQTGISALVNCGGFDKAFATTELSDCGLLTDHAKALSVQKRLRAEYPDEHHADCDVWAIWQMKMRSKITGEQPMSDVPDKGTFASLYSGQPPWDIGRPQKAFIDVANQITGSLLDAGCGTGDNALFFASRGQQITGIDFLAEPINRAKPKAAERGVTATFMVKDALTLKDWSERFDTLIDSGLFHVFNDDDRKRYVEGQASVLKPDGKLFLLCFSDKEPGTQGPRRVSAKEIRDAFAEGWVVGSIEPSRFEVRPDLKDVSFSDGGPRAWFVAVERTGR